MAYRDVRPTCPSCAVALEPEETVSEIDTAYRPQRGRPMLPPRPVRYAAWTRWRCLSCQGDLFEAAHLAALVDEAAGDVRTLAARGAPAAPTETRCPRCAARMAGWTVYGVPLAMCQAHGAWLERDQLRALLVAAYAARR